MSVLCALANACSQGAYCCVGNTEFYCTACLIFCHVTVNRRLNNFFIVLPKVLTKHSELSLKWDCAEGDDSFLVSSRESV